MTCGNQTIRSTERVRVWSQSSTARHFVRISRRFGVRGDKGVWETRAQRGTGNTRVNVGESGVAGEGRR